MERISIITPAYNASQYIGETIRSVQAQDYPCWEMLIVDDCSRDDTCAVVEAYAKTDSRIRLLRQTQNGGPAQARNAAIERAEGRYIAFLDSDDIWLPEKLAHQLAFMREHHAAVSFTRFRRISADGRKQGHLVAIPERLTYWQLLSNTAIATSTAMVDRGLTGPFVMKKTYYDDFALWLDLLKRGFVAHGLQEDLMRYRVVGKSVSRNKGKSAKMVWRTYREVEGLGTPYASWCFANYAVRAFLKYRYF